MRILILISSIIAFHQSPAQNFVKITNTPVGASPEDSRSINWIDIDNDGYQDLMITNGPSSGQNNQLYRNLGSENFSLVTTDLIVKDSMPSDGASWADIDNDGDIDCFVANWYNKNNMLYLNNGNGSFTQITTGAPVNDGGYSETGSWADFDKDGLVDLLVTNSSGSKKNFLYHNDGNTQFTKINVGSIVNDANTSRNICWFDYDNNGTPDALVTNELSQNEDLYKNNVGGSFVRVLGDPLVTNGGKTMSSSAADYDNDGDLDIYLSGYQGYGSLFNNNGDGTFLKLSIDTSAKIYGHSFGSNWADIDNDGDEDLYVTNGYANSQVNNFLFINNGDGSFSFDTTSVITKDKGWWYGCAFGDYNNDGAIDLAVANCYNGNQKSVLYKNSVNANSWIQIKLKGTLSNASAIGARIKVKALINGASRWQMREISAQSGYCGQNMLPAHFGLGNAITVDSIIIIWPSGIKNYLQSVNVNQQIVVSETVNTLGMKDSKNYPLISFEAYPNPSHQQTEISIKLNSPAKANLTIYSSEGKKITTLINARIKDGVTKTTWNRGSSHLISSAHYFAILTIDGERYTIPLIIN